MNQKGFTLIELIVIIVILGILAVTAIPKYVDLKTEAQDAAAEGVLGGAQGAVTMNFAATLLGKAATDKPAYDLGTCAGGLVTTAQCLLNAMEEIPADWNNTAVTAACTGLASVTTAALGGCIYTDTDGSGTLTTDDHVISIDVVEAVGPPVVKAVLSKNW